jgi:poly(3-hydroxybutyrate) depolymerase
MLGRILSVLACVCLWPPISAAAEAKVEKLTFGSGGATRTYYLFVPDKAAGGSAPLLLLLHGSGRNGKTLIDPWLPLAKSEGIVLLAPDASNPQAWRIPQEGPDFFHDLVELVRLTHEVVDERRMYVFGHSAGAQHGLIMGLLESEYFAAVGVHAGLVPQEMISIVDRAPRKIPMAIWTGTDDALIPLGMVRQTRDVLNAQGFNLKLTEIIGHTHDYYSSSGGINKQVWAFLKDQRLAAEPKFQQYQLTK